MNVHDAALAWHDAGACVLPAAADGSKRPALAWDRYKTERPTRGELHEWFTIPGIDGVGIVCGQVSGNVEMFEAEAEAVEAGLVKQLTAMLPVDLQSKLNTYVESSPKGGVHWIFRVDGVPVKGNTKLAREPITKTPETPNGVQVLFETRGEGGWTVIAPSDGPTHPTGRPWQVVYGAAGVIPLLTAEEYRLLHACAATFDQMPPRLGGMEPGPVWVPPAIHTSDGTPGQDFEAKATWEEILLPAGWTRVRQRGDVVEWTRPGKSPRDGISATTGWQGDWFYVFTTSTEFESERTYTKFGTYAVLHHGGDFAAAAGALRKAGYGAKPPPERAKPLSLVTAEGTLTGETMTVPGLIVGGPIVPGPIPSPTTPPAWGEVDLADYLDGTYEPLQTELFQRTDGFCLLYRGRVHSFHGESESGKSWLALHAVAERLAAGGRAAMVDFESNAHTVVGRLLLLGAPRDAIRDRFSYRNPDVTPTSEPRELAEWEKLLSSSFDVLILDGITEALSVFSASSKDNDEVTTWIREIARRLASSTGAAVIMVDHVTKDADTRGRFAIGGQAKMATLDGAAYVIEPVEPLGIGLVGRVSMRVAKDRNGLIRPKSGSYRKSDRTQETAVVFLDASQDGSMVIRVEMFTAGTVDPETGQTQNFRPTTLMERVSRYLESMDGGPIARNRLSESVYGKKTYVAQAIDCLIEDEYAAADGPALNGGKPSIRLIKPYREDGGPVPDLDPSELVPETQSGTPTRSRSKDPGTRDRVGSPSETRSGNGSGPGRDRVQNDTLDLGLEDPDAD